MQIVFLKRRCCFDNGSQATLIVSYWLAVSSRIFCLLSANENISRSSEQYGHRRPLALQYFGHFQECLRFPFFTGPSSQIISACKWY
jgi:hypothetical protein